MDDRMVSGMQGHPPNLLRARGLTCHCELMFVYYSTKENHMKQYYANNFNFEAAASSEASILHIPQR